MSADLPNWLKKTREAVSQRDRQKLESDTARWASNAAKESQAQLLKQKAVEKPRDNINLSIDLWKRLDVDGLIEDVSQHVYPGSKLSPVSIVAGAIEGTLSYNGSAFRIVGWRWQTATKSLSSPDVGEILPPFVPLGADPNKVETPSLVASIFYHWTTPSGSGWEADSDYDHYRYLLTVKMENSFVWASTDESDPDNSSDKKYLQILKIQHNSTSEDLRQAMDQFLAGNIR
jgi:hypothetical protein